LQYFIIIIAGISQFFPAEIRPDQALFLNNPPHAHVIVKYNSTITLEFQFYTPEARNVERIEQFRFSED